ncbi:hypothetical protein RvY_13649 [Ramazzottius varieornatus]|uniref:Uncharacterized protein n=1 Tax=Ramazzottius varieornatus TaxID=947166 RepID=A0A1D1VNN1_RAMVA|nr:hypothetical protein RvY_13649 [Ramazzottius varieornatus]
MKRVVSDVWYRCGRPRLISGLMSLLGESHLFFMASGTYGKSISPFTSRIHTDCRKLMTNDRSYWWNVCRVSLKTETVETCRSLICREIVSKVTRQSITFCAVSVAVCANRKFNDDQLVLEKHFRNDLKIFSPV